MKKSLFLSPLRGVTVTIIYIFCHIYFYNIILYIVTTEKWPSKGLNVGHVT